MATNPLTNFAVWAKNKLTGDCEYIELPGISTDPLNAVVPGTDGGIYVGIPQLPPQGGATVAPSQPASAVNVVFTVNSDPACVTPSPQTVSWELFDAASSTVPIFTGNDPAGTVTLPDLSAFTAPFTIFGVPTDGCGQGAQVSAAFDVFDPGVITPTVSVDVASGQESNSVVGELTYIKHPNCTDMVTPANITWELFDSTSTPIASGATVGSTTLSLPDLTGLSEPFKLEAVVTDGCGTSNLAFATFTVAAAQLSGGVGISVNGGQIDMDCSQLGDTTIDPLTQSNIVCGANGPVKTPILSAGDNITINQTTGQIDASGGSNYTLLDPGVLEISDSSISNLTPELGVLSSVPPGAVAHIKVHLLKTGTGSDEFYGSVYKPGVPMVGTASYTFGFDVDGRPLGANSSRPQRLVWTQLVETDATTGEIEYLVSEAQGTTTIDISVIGYFS